MPAEFQSWIDPIEKHYQFYVFVFSMFVIGMGIARWYGKRSWYEWEKLRRKKLGLLIASLISRDGEQSFTYWGLFQGGLLEVVGVFTLLSYVAVMLVYYKIVRGQIDILDVSGLMSYPPLMLASGVLYVIFQHRRQNALAHSFVIVVVIFCVVTAVVALVGPVFPVLFLIMKEQYQVVVAVQILITIALSF